MGNAAEYLFRYRFFLEGIWFRDFVLLLLPDTGKKMCLVFWVSK